MIDYEKISALEVQMLAKQGDEEALFEMAYRFELMPSGDKGNSVEECAWQDYWLEKAADAGQINAKMNYAYSLGNRPPDKEYCQKSMKYYQELSNDFDAGKISDEKRDIGISAKLMLGIMLCEGNGIERDGKKGVELIEAAKAREINNL